MNCVYLISGDTDIPAKEFNKYYCPAINRAIANDGQFVLGDDRGLELMAQIHLANRRVPNNRVTIYHLHDRVYNGNTALYPTIGRFTSHQEMTTAMIEASGHDIAFTGGHPQRRSKMCEVCSTFTVM